jgi:pimeloyl-ACP methyl ester carboxylesterase
MDHQPISTADHWVGTRRGRLAVRRWEPADRGPGWPVPLVLFHDSLGCIDLWRTFPAVLAGCTGRPVIAYDRLGFGRSDPQAGPLRLDFIQEEALEIFPLLREQLGIGRFIAFGHSVGGAMAAHCAALPGTSCDALITEAAQFFVEDRTRTGILEAKAQFLRPDTFERLRRYHGERSRWVLDAWIDTWLRPEFAHWSLAETLGHVQCPTLVIHGREDEYGSLAHPEGIAQAVRGPVVTAILPGTGHVPHREQEQSVAGQVAHFLESACPR